MRVGVFCRCGRHPRRRTTSSRVSIGRRTRVARFDWSAHARRFARFTPRERDVRIYATRVNPTRETRVSVPCVCYGLAFERDAAGSRARSHDARARGIARGGRATRRIDGDAFTSPTATREIGARTRRTRGATVLTRASKGRRRFAIMEATTTTTTTGAKTNEGARRSLEALGEREFLDDLVRGDARTRERGRHRGY